MTELDDLVAERDELKAKLAEAEYQWEKFRGLLEMSNSTVERRTTQRDEARVKLAEAERWERRCLDLGFAIAQLLSNTDGDQLDDEAEIPVGEIRRVLAEVDALGLSASGPAPDSGEDGTGEQVWQLSPEAFDAAIAESERQIRASIPPVGPTFAETMTRLDADRPSLPLKAKTVRKPSQDVVPLYEDNDAPYEQAANERAEMAELIADLQKVNHNLVERLEQLETQRDEVPAALELADDEDLDDLTIRIRNIYADTREAPAAVCGATTSRWPAARAVWTCPLQPGHLERGEPHLGGPQVPADAVWVEAARGAPAETRDQVPEAGDDT